MPTPLPDNASPLLPYAAPLIALTRKPIRHGMVAGGPLAVGAEGFAEPLRHPAASFVTLHREGALRGCVGAIEPRFPLVQDVARNAFRAAFEDSRFEPVAEAELAVLDIEISVLGTPEPLPFAEERALCAGLVPGRDGLIIEFGERRSVFLPQVWEVLPDPRDFLAHLKAKGGFGHVTLSGNARAFRFTVIKLTADGPKPAV